ncbi:MAG TPA: ABC transporter permease [Chloroflexota bacterium]
MSGRLLLSAIGAQTAIELRLTLRRGESLLITLIVPVLLLVFFSSLGVVQPPRSAGPPVQFLLPGMLALAVISTGMVSVGIATAYERYYGVLKLLGGSPLPRAGLIIAKVLSVLVLEILQIAVLLAVAVAAYGWRPQGGIAGAVGILVLGTAAFTALGLAMAGSLRAEMTLAGANGLYLVFILIGDIVLPISHLPGPMRLFAQLMPAASLTDALRSVLGGVPFAGYAASLAELVAWTVALVLLAALTFHWE